MAIGDTNDMLGRIKALMPRWFGDNPPLLTGLLTGFAWAGSFIYSQISYAKLQTRIKTATDSWLDMIALDFFGSAIVRASSQSDASFRAHIIINIFRERATRTGIVKVLQDLTGRTPAIFEPQRPADTGAYSAPNSGYRAAGGYGSVLLPFQAFVTAYRQSGTGIPNIAGYGASPAGYGVPSQGEYASLSMSIQAVGDSDIYAAVDNVKAIGTNAWVRIVN